MTGVQDTRDLGPRHFAEPILLPYQVESNQEKAKLVVTEKGRRIGLSWGEAAEDALLASKSAADGGMDVWYISYNKEMTEQFCKDVAFWARVYDLAASEIEEDEEVFLEGDERKAVTVYRVRFNSGHRVTGLVSHPRVLRSKQGKVVIDEAAFVDNLDELLKAALALLIWGATVRVISTHNGEDNPFNQLIQEIRAGKRPGAVVHSYPFMEAVEQGLYRKICRKLGIQWTAQGEQAFIDETYGIYSGAADEELDCIPSKGSGAWLTLNMIENCADKAIPIFRWEPPAKNFVDWPEEQRVREVRDWCEGKLGPVLGTLPSGHRYYFGQDFGRYVDLSVLWPLERLDSLDLWTPFTVEMRDMPFEAQKQLLFYVVDRFPRFCGGALDSTGNGMYLGEVARQRYTEHLVHQVMLNEPWYREHMPRTKAQFEDRTIFIPRDAQVTDDLRLVKMVKGVARVPDLRTEAAKGGKRHGDAAVSVALAVYAAKVIDGAPMAMAEADPDLRVRVTDQARAHRPNQPTTPPRLFGRQTGVSIRGIWR